MRNIDMRYHYLNNLITGAVKAFARLSLYCSHQSELPQPIRRKPWNQTTDVHRGSTLITRVM